MALRVDRKPPPGESAELPPRHGDIVFFEGKRALVRVEASDVGEIIAAPGTIWRPSARPTAAPLDETIFGGGKHDQEWHPTQPGRR
jgi:hypothetical protein